MTNIIILGRFDFKRVLGNLIFMVPFSWLVGVFEVQLLKLHITHLPLWSQVILDCLGSRLDRSSYFDLSAHKLDAPSS